ncbi:MAG: DMT family transporter [Myxococcota bacterium]
MFIGEIAAIIGSCLWSTGSMFFTASVKRIGVLSLNLFRTFVAAIFLLAATLVIFGTPFPEPPTTSAIFWLALSGVVGLGVGDLFYFSSLKASGARITMLFLSLAPPFSAIIERIVVGETMSPLGFLGMFVTIFGVSWVVSERKFKENGEASERVTTPGMFYGTMMAFCQAGGLVFSKMGLETVNALTGTLIRMITSVVVLFAFVVAFRKWDVIKRVFANKEGAAFAVGGAFFGPFLGVTMSLLAVKYTKASVAMTLLSTTPITILPFAILINKERVSPRAALGAFVAVLGVTLLFLR